MSNKKTAKKSTIQTNVDRITKTAKSVNKQVLETVEALVEDAKANGTQVRTATTTSFENIELKKSFNTVFNTAKNINTQVLETTTEVLEDVYESGMKWSAAAVETAKNRVNDIDVTKNIEQVRATAKKANDFTLKTADTLIEDAFANGEKWQGVAAKAVKGGLQLAERQQEIVFDTLEEVKGQLQQSATRFRGLFSKN